MGNVNVTAVRKLQSCKHVYIALCQWLGVSTMLTYWTGNHLLHMVEVVGEVVVEVVVGEVVVEVVCFRGME